MRRVVLAIAALAMAGCPLRPALAEIIRTDAALAGRTVGWDSGGDSEQFGREHNYSYSYHVQVWTTNQYVAHGRWSVSADGTVTLNMEGGAIVIRKYDVRGDRVVELTGSLNGGENGYFC